MLCLIGVCVYIYALYYTRWRKSSVCSTTDHIQHLCCFLVVADASNSTVHLHKHSVASLDSPTSNHQRLLLLVKPEVLIPGRFAISSHCMCECSTTLTALYMLTLQHILKICLCENSSPCIGCYLRNANF